MILSEEPKINSNGSSALVKDNRNLKVDSSIEPRITTEVMSTITCREDPLRSRVEGGEAALLLGSSLATSMARHALNDISVQLPGNNWELLLQTHSQLLEEAAIFDVYSCLGKRECDPSSSGLEVEFTPTLNTGAVLTLKHTSDALEVHLLVTQQDRLREYTYDNVMKMYNFFQEKEQFTNISCSPFTSTTALDAETTARRRVTASFGLRFRGDWTSILLQRRGEWMIAFCKDICRHLKLQHTDVRHICLQQHEITEDENEEDVLSKEVEASTLDTVNDVNELEVTFALCVSEHLITGDMEYGKKLSTCRYGRVWMLYFETNPSDIPFDLHYCFSGEYWETILEQYTSELEEAALRDIEHHLRHHAEDAAVLGIGTMFLMAEEGAHLFCKFTRWNDPLRRSIGRRLERCRFEEVWKLYRELSTFHRVTLEQGSVQHLYHYFRPWDNYFTEDEDEDEEMRIMELVVDYRADHKSLNTSLGAISLSQHASLTGCFTFPLVPDALRSHCSSLHREKIVSPLLSPPSLPLLPLLGRAVPPPTRASYEEQRKEDKKGKTTDENRLCTEEGKRSRADVSLACDSEDTSLLVQKTDEREGVTLPMPPSNASRPHLILGFTTIEHDKEPRIQREDEALPVGSFLKQDTKHARNSDQKNAESTMSLTSNGDNAPKEKTSANGIQEIQTVQKEKTESAKEPHDAFFVIHSEVPPDPPHLPSSGASNPPFATQEHHSKNGVSMADDEGRHHSTQNNPNDDDQKSSALCGLGSSHFSRSALALPQEGREEQPQSQLGFERVERVRYSTSGSLLSSTSSFHHGFSVTVDAVSAFSQFLTTPPVLSHAEHEKESTMTNHSRIHSDDAEQKNGKEEASSGGDRPSIRHSLPDKHHASIPLSFGGQHHPVEPNGNHYHHNSMKQWKAAEVEGVEPIQKTDPPKHQGCKKVEEVCKAEKKDPAADGKDEHNKLSKCFSLEVEEEQKAGAHEELASTSPQRSEEAQQVGEEKEVFGCTVLNKEDTERDGGNGKDEGHQVLFSPLLVYPVANTSCSSVLVGPSSLSRRPLDESVKPSLSVSSCRSDGRGDGSNTPPNNDGVHITKGTHMLQEPLKDIQDAVLPTHLIPTTNGASPLPPPCAASSSILSGIHSPLQPLNISGPSSLVPPPPPFFSASKRISGRSSFFSGGHCSHSSNDELLLPISSSCIPNGTTSLLLPSLGPPSRPPLLVPRGKLSEEEGHQGNMMSTSASSSTTRDTTLKKEEGSGAEGDRLHDSIPFPVNSSRTGTTIDSRRYPPAASFPLPSASSRLWSNEPTTTTTTSSASTRLPELPYYGRDAHAVTPCIENTLHQSEPPASGWTTASASASSHTTPSLHPSVGLDQERPLRTMQHRAMHSAISQCSTSHNSSTNCSSREEKDADESRSDRKNPHLRGRKGMKKETRAEEVDENFVEQIKSVGGGRGNADLTRENGEQEREVDAEKNGTESEKEEWDKHSHSEHHFPTPPKVLDGPTALPYSPPLPLPSAHPLPLPHGFPLLPPIRR